MDVNRLFVGTPSPVSSLFSLEVVHVQFFWKHKLINAFDVFNPLSYKPRWLSGRPVDILSTDTYNILKGEGTF